MTVTINHFSEPWKKLLYQLYFWYIAQQRRHTGSWAKPECPTDHECWLPSYTNGMKTSEQTWTLVIIHSVHDERVKSPQFLLLLTAMTEKAHREVSRVLTLSHLPQELCAPPEREQDSTHWILKHLALSSQTELTVISSDSVQPHTDKPVRKTHLRARGK